MRKRRNLSRRAPRTIPIPKTGGKSNVYNILNRGLPFEVKISVARLADVSEPSKAELNAELEKGYANMTTGRTKPASHLLIFAKVMSFEL